MRRSGLTFTGVLCAVMTIWLIPAICPAQAPYPPPTPMAPPPPGPGQVQPMLPPQAPVQQQPAPGMPMQPQQPPGQGSGSLEYAFRPDLTNPEFGVCLNLEKQWKDLWQHYYQLYSQIRTMNPNDPRYARLTYYAQGMKAQLDAAWNDFSSRCVYFPQR